MSSFIGAGERTAAQILRFFYPQYKIDTQVPLFTIMMVKGGIAELSSRQRKETIDIVFYAKKTIAVRLHGKKGSGKMRAEGHQRDLLESIGWKVIDVHRRDCPELFAEKFNWKAVWELFNCFADQKISPNI